MKKLSDDYLLRQRRIAKDRFKRKLRHLPHRRARMARVFGYQIIYAPDYLTLLPEHIDSVILFVRKFSTLASTVQKVVIDFADTQSVSALAAVYLYSEIDRAQRRTPNVQIRRIYQAQVRYALQITGILALCGYPAAPVGGPTLPVVKGTDDSGLKDITQYLMGTALLGDQLGIDNLDRAEHLANKAIGEAMLNVSQHAYPHDQPYRFWWVTAAILRDELHIALCDRGVGIPSTLPQKSMFKKLVATFVPGIDDAEMIKQAMRYTRSSRDDPSGGGLGSRDIQALVLQANKGQLTIVSGMGHYRLEGEGDPKGSNEHETATKIGHNVDGTLIQWRIPLQHQPGGTP